MLLQPLRWCYWSFCALLLGLRYRVRTIGLKGAAAKRGPFLVLPNHPAFSDPPNVLKQLWPTFKFRPVVNEINFKNPVLGPMGWLMRTINLPDMEHTSAESFKRVGEGIQRIKDALAQGDNVILWPSGRLMRDGRERLGGARAVSDILRACPNVTLVLVRTRGLWGSSWSWANGPIPGLFSLLGDAVVKLLASGVFFAPRRDVTMTVEAFRTDERPPPNRDALNVWLEAWYNADTDAAKQPNWPGETPTFVPYHHLHGPRAFDFPPPYNGPESDISKVTADIKSQVADIIAAKIGRRVEDRENRAETSFMDLGIDSLDGMEISLQVEQRFGFTGDEVPQKLSQLWAIAVGTARHAVIKPVPGEWLDAPSDTDEITLPGSTIAEAFVLRCLKHPRDTAAADDLAGVVSYGRLLLGAMLLARRFHKYPEPNIGLMLPASVGADTALMALHLAGKLPVILNWTTGPNNLEHAVTLMGLKRVITSKLFIDRAHLSVPGAEFVYLEDVRKTIGKREALTIVALMRLFPDRVKADALRYATTDADAPCVVLFTSGSDKAPKAVPLSHANVLVDIRDTMPILKFTRSDSVLAFLPLFHSFGHTVMAIFPLLVGFKVLHHPDPTDAAGLVRKIAAYKPSIVAGTPTFIGFIFEKAKPGDLDSLRIIVVGAEKCPEHVFEKCRTIAPNATIVEGYGITECSPVIAFNPPMHTRPGKIGLPLTSLRTLILDVETRAAVPPGEMGLLLVTGPTMFRGYYGTENADPFETIDGTRYYNTGDLVALDNEGYIEFRGRLKRYLKAGGEMISLPALEEPFAKNCPPDEHGPRVAVEGIETPTGRRIVLFTREEMTLHEANQLLQDNGFRGVMRLDDVQRVDAIPVLGTGKTDYKVLRAKIAG